MLADFEAVLDRLEVASRKGETAICFCPAHDDRNNPSLSVKAENGRLLLHCFAGCRPEDIVSAIGLQMEDLFVDEVGGLSIPPSYCTLARYQRRPACQRARRAREGRFTPAARLHAG